MMKKIFENNWILLLILLAGFLVRLVGCNPGLQQGLYPDEVMSYGSATEMIINGDLNPRRYDYPAGVALLHMVVFRMVFLPLALFKLFFPHPRVFLTALKLGPKFLEEFRQLIFGWREIEALYWSRYFTALLGTGTVFLTYLLARRLFGKTTALLAAFFLAFNYRHVLSSHFALPDVPNSLFSVLALYAAVLLLEKNTRGRYLFASLSVAFALSIKYQIFAFLPFLVVHLVWVVCKKSFKELFNPNFILAAFLIPIVFIILNPYLIIHLREALPIIKYVAGRYGMGVKRFNFYPLFYLYHWGLGRLPSLAIVLGLLLSLVLKPLASFLLLTFIAPFFFVFIYYCYGGGYVRNFVTVIPFLTIFAGFCLESFFNVLRRLLKIPHDFLLIFLVLIVFWINFIPIKNSLMLSYFYSKPWNSVVFKEWLMKNLPADIKLRIYPLYLPAQDQIAQKVKIVNWERKFQNSLVEFREAGDDFVAMNVTFNWNYMYWWFNLPPRQMIKYQGVPQEILANSFEGLMIKELLPYTVAEVYKPWQAAEENNYLLFKIPQQSRNLGGQIASFTFDKEEEIWEVKGNFGHQILGFSWNSVEGYPKKGSLEIQGGRGDFQTTRFSSPPIPIESGKYYTVVGWIKNSKELQQEDQDGFLRLDFYRSLEEAKSEKVRMKVALSSRVWGKSNWVKKEVGTDAPPEAKFLTVSFQRSEPALDFSSYLDEVIVYESDKIPEEKFKELPYIKSTIPEDLLYPNSIL